MKEFYIKTNKNNEPVFFYRIVKEKSCSREEWISKIKKLETKEFKYNFDEFLKFLKKQDYSKFETDDFLYETWNCEEYLITKMTLKKLKIKEKQISKNSIILENICYNLQYKKEKEK